MGEIKSVKVDNWGVFFLQKLQNFFNKTDYCDLTLQFRDNSQLKVHRLVLSACTDFFNVLEQTCELIDDALVMPNELQADVVVPIVNFMYTGTLEFELRMYNKLLKTAREMNMTVLLKLLEAHKRTMESSIKVPPRSGSPKLKSKRLISSPTIAKVLPSSVVSSTQQRRKVITGTPTTPVRRIITPKPTSVASIFRQANNSLLKVTPKMQRGPTRFETTESNTPSDTYEPSFDSISYESKPMKEEPEEYEEMQTSPAKHRSSPFEQLRKGYNNNKRPAISAFTSPPAKKPNIEDVKEFSEQQRMRKQIAAEYGDDAEYDGVMDDDIHNDDDDEEPSSNPSSAKQQTPQTQPQGSIIIKQSPNEKPTIVVKDSSNSKMDHAKIISEVLRQYPHLVKGNKNIKLKIMPNVGGQPQKIIVKKEAIENAATDTEPTKHQQAQQQLLQISQKQTRITSKGQIVKPSTSTKVEGQATATVTSVETVVAADRAANATKSAPAEPTPKRRIDSKTMHVLIAQGAANTTGPWLCLRCGLNGRPISIPTYRGFRRHLINTHKEVIDPALCEQCGWRSSNTRHLSHHMMVEHNIPSLVYAHPKCEHCSQICVDKNDLDLHLEKAHPNVHKQQCIYCNKIFFKEMQLYTHMKTFHKKLAREDGVLDFSEDELTDFDDEIKNIYPQSSTEDKKIKIISDIALPSTLLKLEDVQQVEEDFGNESGPKFVNADGNEMVLTAEQREEIMSQLEQDHDGGVVMVLNEPAFPQGEAVVAGQEPKTEASEALDDYNDANIYNEFTEEEVAGEFGGQEPSAEVGALDGPKEEEDEEETHEQDHEESGHEERIDDDHMEWAENLISAHDADDNDHDEDEEEPDVGDEEMDDDEEIVKKTTSKISVTKDDEEKVSSSNSPSDNLKGDKPKNEDDISMKLKELTGDWTDDEIEDDDDEEDEVKRDIEESDKNKTDEDLQAQLIGENTAEIPTSADVDNVGKKTEEIKDSQAKVEAKPKPTQGKDDTEDQISQSKQSEKTEDDEILSKGDIKEENLSSEDHNISADSPLETETSDKIIDDAEAKEKPDSSTAEETKPRRTSSTDNVKPAEVPLPTDEDKSLDEAISEESSTKISSLEKPNDDSLETDDKQNDDKEQKVESSSDKEDTVTSSKSPKDDSLKSEDKVKSLISEWADDDDEM